jgi:glycosyltransferase involved in cell wall biosynthesis
MGDQDLGFSLIIPTFARPQQLGNCLESLTQLIAPRSGFEIIIVDDGSPESLEPVVAPFREKLNLRLLRQANGGPAQARNTGAAAARGRHLAFTDDDCRPEPDWLCALERAAEEAPNDLLGGRTVNLLTREACASTSQLIIDMVYAFFNQNPGDARLLASNNMAMPAAIFHRLNGFDAASYRKAAGEDRDLCTCYRNLGYRLQFVPQAVIGHAHHLTLWSFWRQHFGYGQAAWIYHRKHAQVIPKSLQQDAKLHTQMYRWLPGPLRKLTFWMRVQVLPLLVVWQVANAAGFFSAAFQARKNPKPVSDS